MTLPAPRPDDRIRRAQAGDRAAWRALVEEHGPMVWGLCRRLAADPEDAYQDVWVKVLRALGRFDPEGDASFHTWLRTVTHRHLVDLHRRRRTRGPVLLVGDLADPGPGAEEHLAEGRRREALEAALAALPEPARRIVVLHHLAGAPLQEIAAEEGVSLGTVKSRLHRARARLAELLGGIR